ncbi:hypothetical protein FS837_006480 [Tulasnella sp. UAMH 9824]|nr:hypothetical protein FS837_006480 [Tulasnella sp. UAMH 9824]
MEPLPYKLEADARQEIRAHLSDHLQKHLAINSDDYTIQEAETLLSGILRHVLLSGPTDMGPPRDFIELLSDNPSISELSLPDDRLSISVNVLQWLKQLKTQVGRTERICTERELSRFALDEATHALSPHHPMELLISRRSKRQTPMIGSGMSVDVLPNALVDIKSELGLSSVPVPELGEQTVNQEQVLSLRFSLDTRTKTEIGNLLSSLPMSITSAGRPTRAASSRRQDPIPTAITDFLTSEAPIPTVSHRMSPPLFPRVPPSLVRTNQYLGNDLSDVHRLVGGKVDMEQDEFDYVKESFKLVDGWNPLPDLSSSTANSDMSSPTSPRREITDKYWFSSSDEPDVTLDQWKMDSQYLLGPEEVEFPRSQRASQPLFDLMAKTTGICSMEDVVGDPIPGDAQFPPKWSNHSTDDMPSSVLGAVASNTESRMEPDDADSLLAQVYKDVEAQDPLSLILNEKMDQKDSNLMDVPDLPDPCGRSSTFPNISHLSIMLAPPVKKGELAPKCGETTIPTLGSTAGVDGELALEPRSTEFLQETKRLLFEPPGEMLARFEDSDTTATSDLPHTEDQRHDQILLTRLETRRLASAQLNSAPQASDNEDEELDELEDSDVEMVDESNRKPSTPVQGCLRQQPLHPDAFQGPDHGYAIAELAPPDTSQLVMVTPPLFPQAPTGGSTFPASETPLSKTSRRNLPPAMVGPNELGTNSNRTKLFQFLNLRGRSQLAENAQDIPPSPQQGNLPNPQSSPKHWQEPLSIPEEVLAHCSFHINRKVSCTLSQPTVYKYIATCDMIQKRGICHHLASEPIKVYLVERPNLADVDLIVDAGAAIVYLTLAALPVDANDVAERVSKLSFAYSRLLLVFEAYPPSKSRTAYLSSLDDSRIPKHEDLAESAILPYAFSPPVLKAFKHLRRSLVIAESTGEKLPSCRVDIAFALDQEESAWYARIFGDARVRDCQTDSNSAMSGPWDDRSWLVEDAYEGEAELASFEGLNLFASIAMLRLVNLDSIIDEMTSEQRLSYFANEVGRDRVLRFNHAIETRLRTFAASPSTS